jgi:hypothetical protein
MTTPTSLPALGAALLTLAAAGCDSDTASPANYRLVAHADVAALLASPLVADAMKKDKVDLSAELGPCGDLVTSATAVTVGANEDAFELYVAGKFTAKQSKACIDHIEAELAKDKGASADERVDTLQLGDGLFAVYRGPAKPSRSRLAALHAADPSPARTKPPMWFVAHDDANKGEVEHVEGWASMTRGVDAHVEIHFDSATAAAEVYGQAALGLAAMRMSDEMGELAKAVKVSSGGDTLTAEFHASNEVLRKVLADRKVAGKLEAERGGQGKSGATVSIELGDE